MQCKRMSHFIFALSFLLFGCYPGQNYGDSSVQETRYQAYLQFLQENPLLGPLGDVSKGEIQISKDVKQMSQLEASMGRIVGIVARDNYWIWVNDPVIFPSGKAGVYGRLLWVNSLKGFAGVAVMPILPDGRIVLNRNYRHATRSWEYELPRGCTAKNETMEAAARREVQEETGMILDELIFLGNMAPDSGLTNTIVPIFCAKVKAQENATPEDSEAIAGIEAFTLVELQEGYVKGYISKTIGDEVQQIPLRDPFLAFALLQASFRHIN